MNKYFWIWLVSCILYALGIITIVITDNQSILSAGYICNEFFQVSALLCVFYACCQADNIPRGLTGIQYGVILMILLIAYAAAYGLNNNIYIIMLLFKLAVVLMIVFMIIVRWNFTALIKTISVVILGSSGVYLSLYDFFVYGGQSRNDRAIIYVCVGVIFLIFQNLNLAVLYKIQVNNQKRLTGDYLDIFAENSADIIFYYTINPYPRFAFVSPASKTLLGYSPEDFYNNSKLHLEVAMEEDRRKMSGLFCVGQHPKRKDVVRVERRDGEIVYLEAHVSQIWMNKKLVAVEGIFRDITERAAAEQKVIENNRNRQLMLSYISHDLKTPITYISGYSEAILKEVIKSDADKKKAIEAIHSKSNSLAKLVEDISLLSKLEASRFNYEFEAISCIDLIDHIRLQHSHDFSSSENPYGFINRQYVFEVENNLTEKEQVLADLKRIDQVFDNLLSNAIKATDQGGAIEILCGLDRKRNFYISVSDNGPGIAEADLPHIFENFYRSPETKKRSDGSGLGLSLSRQIMLGHGGKLYAESVRGQGCQLTFTIPLFQAEE